jgi:sugar transferase (PEP-CTERM/EpsH1 system associated)
MTDLLFLVHRLPYPPNKGDKIRSFHLLRYLAKRHRVHLATFVDAPEDWAHVDSIREYCEELCVRPLRPNIAKMRSIAGLLRTEALTLPYYRDEKMKRWVAQLLERRSVESVIAFSSSMAQYLPQDRINAVRCVMDFVDVDSDKWRQYSQNVKWPLSWLYEREAERLQAYEREIARSWDVSVFVTEEEAATFRAIAPEAAPRVHSLENGVDVDYFSCDPKRESPFDPEVPTLVFTGAMDYRANVDAVTWFARVVWPEVRRQRPDSAFWIVGARPTGAVRSLAGQPGIEVAGAVPDVRPYLQHARAAVAPLRIARGVQNKVLEALSMEQRVVMTTAAADGIPVSEERFVAVSDNPGDFAASCVGYLTGPPSDELRQEIRQWVVARYQWANKLAKLDRWLSEATTPKSEQPGSDGRGSSAVSVGGAA